MDPLSSPSSLYTRPHLWQISGGGSGPPVPPPLWIRACSQSESSAAILFFLIGPKHTNLVKDVEILLSAKFHWKLFSGFKGEVKNELIRDQDIHLVFPIDQKNANVVHIEDVEISIPVKFRWIPFSSFREKWKGLNQSYYKNSYIQRKIQNVTWQHKNATKNFNNTKIADQLRTVSGSHNIPPLVWLNQLHCNEPSTFPPAVHNNRVIKRIHILKIVNNPPYTDWGPTANLSGVDRGEVENVSTNQRSGRPSCFSDRPAKQNLVEVIEILLSVKFHWKLFNGFRKEVKMSQSGTRTAILFFRSARKHKHRKGRWNDLASCQVSLNSIQRF